MQQSDMLKEEQTKLAKQQETVENNLATIRPKIDAQKEEQSAITDSYRQKLEVLRKERSVLAEPNEKIARIESQLASIDINALRTNLQSCTQSIKSREENRQSALKKLNEINEEISGMTKTISETKILSRTVEDNIKHRQMVREKHALTAKIQVQRELLQGMGGSKLEEEYRQLETDYSELQQKVGVAICTRAYVLLCSVLLLRVN